MKLTIQAFLTLDGVMQGPGNPDEDTTGGFDRGGWMPPLADAGSATIVDEWYREADAILFGRTTYDLFSGHWPRVTDPDDVVATTLNTVPKYVASTTLTDPRWSGTTVLAGDVLAQIVALKGTSGRELQVHGSWELARTLHHAGVVDEYRLLVFPVTVGPGKRLFGPVDPPAGLRLLETRQTPAGAVYLRYEPTVHRGGAFVVREGRTVPAPA